MYFSRRLREAKEEATFKPETSFSHVPDADVCNVSDETYVRHHLVLYALQLSFLSACTVRPKGRSGPRVP